MRADSYTRNVETRANPRETEREKIRDAYRERERKRRGRGTDKGCVKSLTVEQRNKMNPRGLTHLAGVPAPLLELYPLLHGRQAVPNRSSCSCSSVPPLRARTPRIAHPPLPPYVRTYTSVRPHRLSCVATPHQLTCQQPCSLAGREYNMTDGHGRTTVGHRTVRGQDREPLLPCVRTCVRACSLAPLARSLARSRASRVRACRVERKRDGVRNRERERERR